MILSLVLTDWDGFRTVVLGHSTGSHGGHGLLLFPSECFNLMESESRQFACGPCIKNQTCLFYICTWKWICILSICVCLFWKNTENKQNMMTKQKICFFSFRKSLQYKYMYWKYQLWFVLKKTYYRRHIWKTAFILMLKNNESKLKKATGFICKLLTDGTFNTQNHALYRMLSYSTILYREDTYKHL